MQAKTMIVNGQTITGKNYGDLRRQLQALGLTPEMMTNYASVAKQLFPKTDDAGSSKQRHGSRNGRQTQDKATVDGVVRTEMNLGGIKLQVIEGPMKQVLRQIGGRPRNMLFAAVETFLSTKKAVVILVKGDVSKIEYGTIDKAALEPYFKRPGFSMLTSIKAVGDRRQGITLHVTGQDLSKPNVKEFVQALVRHSYRGTDLVGAGLNGETISTNVFLAPEGLEREAASWPIDNPGAYAVAGIGNAPISILGSHGYVSVDRAGKVLLANFASIIAAGLASLFNKAATITKTAWTEIGSFDLGKIGGSIVDVSVAMKFENNSYRVFVSGPTKVAVLTFAWKNDAYVLDQDVKYLAYNNDASMAIIGRANDETLILGNRNGGPRAVEFVQAKEFGKDFQKFFATATPASAPTAQA